jgi:phosphinothricin acetyltransferase
MCRSTSSHGRWSSGAVGGRDGAKPALVGEAAGDVVGMAYAGPYRDKGGSRSSVETTVVLDPEWTGRGLGERLLSALLEKMADAGAHRAYAIVALPNEASVKLHERLGYRSVGVLDEVGRKMAEYWSTLILEKRLD